MTLTVKETPAKLTAVRFNKKAQAMLHHVLTSFVCEQRKMSKNFFPTLKWIAFTSNTSTEPDLNTSAPGGTVAYSTIYFNKINMQLRQNNGKTGDGLQTLKESSHFLIMTFLLNKGQSFKNQKCQQIGWTES